MKQSNSFSDIFPTGITDFPLYVWWSSVQPDTIVHRHDFVELVIVTGGTGKHVCGRQRWELRRGEVFVIPRGVSHAYEEGSPDFSLVNLLYTPEALSVPLLDINLLPGFRNLFYGISESGELFPHLHVEEDQLAFPLQLAAGLYRESRTRSPGYMFRMLGIFMAILGELARIFSQSRLNGNTQYRNIAEVIAYLNRHFRESVDIEILCKLAGMSRPSLQRNFHQATGTSPLQYLLQLRIAEAVTLLRTSQKTIDEIAVETGFRERNYFSRQFRRLTGKPPAVFRRSGSHSFRPEMK